MNVRHMALQALIRWFLPKEEHFYDALEELARKGHEAAQALERFRERPAAEIQQGVQAIEHQADRVVHDLEDALARTFVTPLDREDLHSLAGALDDIIDKANLAARAFNLYRLEKPSEAMVQLMGKLGECTAQVRDAVPKLRAHQYESLIEFSRKVQQVEKEADTIYRAAVTKLFSEAPGDFREFLKQKEALDDLEAAIDHCDDVASLLSNLAVKHG